MLKKKLGGIEPEGAINMLAKGLAGFLGYVSQGDYNFSDSGVIQHGKGYTSKYKDATWDGSDNNGEMARIFLCAATIAFLGLSFLCWKCKQTQGGWNGGSLTGSGTDPLGFFMTTMGYQSKYFDGVKKGTDVASLLEENEKGFDGLVQPATKNIYDDFIQALETQYKPASNALNSPLTACYKFAKEYFTSQFKKPKGEVTDQTLTSIKDALQGFKSSCQNSAQDLSDQIGNFIKIAMTSPSSVLSNPKNNTDTPRRPRWGGGNGTTDLTKQVTQLLSEVESYGTEIGVDSGKVQKALDNGSGNGLIAKLAEGLQQFIGYDNRGKLTGGGILPANVAKHQVCNAVLNFVIRFLEGLCEIKELDSQNKEGVKTVIGTLRKCVGSGNVPTGFGQLVGKIREKVETNSGFQGGVGQSLKTIFEKLRGIVTTARFENGGDNVEDLQSFLGEVLKDSGTEQSRNFQSLCDELKNLFEESEIKTSLSTDKKLELNSLRGKIDQVTKQANKINPSSFKTSKVAKALAAGVKSAATAFIAEIKDPGKYTSYYDKAEWNSVSGEDERTKCAKIFLGCLPLYYQALTYILGCHDKGGGWGVRRLPMVP
ncbi:variant erythrocyte surface antigen-1 family protein [Babesia caballi]|uniref:Variant erythrocyte surface antigen-1 family protein n=1 Tax=Babesia caballi TaxID=5871 RepID=A0AAV4M3J1_BABCB|nr:variant erythrocyte surface antigen-1 family protein [Babesia caballi]